MAERGRWGAGVCGATWGDVGYVSAVVANVLAWASTAFVEVAVLASSRMVEVLATILGEVRIVARGLRGGGGA